MLTALLALILLFAVSALLWWWARGGVLPALMMSAPGLAMLPVVAVGLHDVPGWHNLGLGVLYVGGPVAFAWAPRMIRRRRAIPSEIAAISRPLLAVAARQNASPGPLDRSEIAILRGAGIVGAVCAAILTCHGASH